MRTDDDIKRAWVHATMPLDDTISVFVLLDYAFECLNLDEISPYKYEESKREYQRTGILSDRLKTYLARIAKEYQKQIMFNAAEVDYLCEVRKVAWE